MSAKVRTDSKSFEWEIPREIFDTGVPNATFSGRSDYVNAPDGQRFIVTVLRENVNGDPITVVLNWAAVLSKK